MALLRTRIPNAKDGSQPRALFLDALVFSTRTGELLGN
jgi:hypothetical protein